LARAGGALRRDDAIADPLAKGRFLAEQGYAYSIVDSADLLTAGG
jgi:hypothetical protein